MCSHHALKNNTLYFLRVLLHDRGLNSLPYTCAEQSHSCAQRADPYDTSYITRSKQLITLQVCYQNGAGRRTRARGADKEEGEAHKFVRCVV